ncbi:MAG: aminopeptidase [Patescibacteria group bacterium]|nr:MAG: aminopeptidase [Patescibacteria group bacterium]
MYKPSQQILENYAKVLINFALNSGKGLKPKEVVFLDFEESAKDLGLEVYKRIILTGGHPIVRMYDENFSRVFFELASINQIEFAPNEYYKGLVKTIDHRVSILSNKDPLYLKGVPAEKLVAANKSVLLLKRLMFEKEDAGKFTWTLGLYGTKKQADQAKLSLEDYWSQIIKACFLDTPNPVAHWRKVFEDLERIRTKLNKLNIKTIKVTAKDTDLVIGLGEKRLFAGGSGRNIPSFELFTSPDWRLVEGRVYFDQPLYRFGNLLQGVYLEFKKGRVVKAKAKKNEKLLQQMIKQKNADKVGEFSLTDKRFSKIDKFMANTLYDENFGGSFGNMHLALGSSYHDCFAGNPKNLKDKDWQKLGFNDSVEHTDIVQSLDRVVEAELNNGSKIFLYKNGQFLI